MFAVAAALLTAMHAALAVSRGDSTAKATPVAPCDMRLRVELTSDVPDPRDVGFVSSLLGNHVDYQLTLQRQDLDDSFIIGLDLTGPGPEAACRQVVASMRTDARVISVEVLRDVDLAALPGGTAQGARDGRRAIAVPPLGTVRAGPDGDWILEPLNGVSRVRLERDRYQCDIWAAAQTGFDPTQDDGGVPPEAVPGKRADYLRAEVRCFQDRGYVER